MSKTVWVFQTGEPLPIDTNGSRAMRAMSLSDSLVRLGHRVVLWSADFNHSEHRHRFGRRTRIHVSDRMEVRLLSSQGYDNNLGVQRVIDHAQLALDLRRVLQYEAPPDVAFVGFPPIEPAAYMGRWLTRHRVPFMVDVKDAWPDIFLRAFPKRLGVVGRAALAPHDWMTRRCFERATALSSISDEFLLWSANRAGRPVSALDRVTPLTAPAPSAEPADSRDDQFWNDLGVPNDGEFRVFFVGTLHSSYDWVPVAEAARTTGVQVVIGGDGSRSEEVRTLMSGLPNVVMPGWVTAGQAEALAQRCSVALAPIAAHPDYVMSVPNKFYDAWAKGLPIVTGLTGAVERVIADHGVGAVYGVNSEDLGEILLRLRADRALVSEMGRRAQRLYVDQFDHRAVYDTLAASLVELANRDVDAIGAGKPERVIDKHFEGAT